MLTLSEELKENIKEKPKKVAFSTYVTAELKGRLDNFCKENNRSRSDVISYLIGKL